MTKLKGPTRIIRYSKAFKLQMVKEVEDGRYCPYELGRKYQVSNGMVLRWVRQYGSGKHGKIIRVERPDEVNEASRLRRQLRQLKEALADVHMELALEKAFLEAACEEMKQTPEAFKKKHAGGRRTRR